MSAIVVKTGTKTKVKVRTQSVIVVSGTPPIEIDSLDGGTPSDTVYVAINANGLTGISGGTP